MAGVFRSTQTHAGSFNTASAEISFGGDAAGHLAQSIQYSFTQPVNMVYELGSQNVYFVAGRAQGQLSMARVVGPAGMRVDLITKYNDICSPQSLNLKGASAACTPGSSSTSRAGGIDYLFSGVTLSSLSGSITAQDMLINENLQFMFIDMDINGGNRAA